MNKIRVFIISMLLCCGLVFEAHATQVQVTLTIDDILTAANPYSVSELGTYQWTVEYDQGKIQYDPLNPSFGILTPWYDSTLQLAATIGTYHFQLPDAFLGPMLPALTFTNGVLDGFFMFAVLDYVLDGNGDLVLDTNGQPIIEYVNTMGGNQYLLTVTDYDPDLNNYIYAGHFSFPTTPIPEPATMLLLGSGLAGLAGLRRKFRKN